MPLYAPLNRIAYGGGLLIVTTCVPACTGKVEVALSVMLAEVFSRKVKSAWVAFAGIGREFELGPTHPPSNQNCVPASVTVDEPAPVPAPSPALRKKAAPTTADKRKAAPTPVPKATIRSRASAPKKRRSGG